VSKEVNRKLPAGNTTVYNFQPPIPTLSATMHRFTDGQSLDRPHYDANSRLFCVLYDRLISLN